MHLSRYIAIYELLKVYYYLKLLIEGYISLYFLLSKVFLEATPISIYKSL